MEEEDLVSEQPTVIRGSNPLDDEDSDAFLVGMSSDSDVQLISNELLTDLGGSDLISMGNSDSDVRLVDAGMTDLGSDSDVKLVGGSESDVKLVGGSDSDVLIVGGSDSDVRIMEDDSDSDVQLVPEDRDEPKTEHDMPTMEEEDSDSDVTLVPPPPDSGIDPRSGRHRRLRVRRRGKRHFPGRRQQHHLGRRQRDFPGKNRQRLRPDQGRQGGRRQRFESQHRGQRDLAGRL